MGVDATRADDVSTLVCIQSQSLTAGRYYGTQISGLQISWRVSIFNASDRTFIAEQTFYGGPPPASIEVRSRYDVSLNPTGSSPSEEAFAWMIETLRPPNTLAFNEAPEHLSFSMDGRLLAFSTKEHQVLVAEFDQENPRPLALTRIVQDPEVGLPLAFSPTERKLAISISGNGTYLPRRVRFYGIDTKQFPPGEMLVSHVRSLLVSPDGRFLAIRGDYGASLWSAQSRTEVWPLNGLSSYDGTIDMAFDNNSQNLFGGSADGIIYQYAVADGSLVRKITRGKNTIGQLALSATHGLFSAPAINVLKSLPSKPELVQWAIPPRSGFWGNDLPTNVYEFASWPRAFLISSRDQKVYLVHTGNDKRHIPKSKNAVLTLQVPYFTRIAGATISPSGRWLAVSGYIEGAYAHTLRIFEVAALMASESE